MAKRFMDITLGTALAIAATPVILVLAVAVAISFRSWPFFVQTRVGRGGRHFRFPKLRTLPATAPRYADKYTIQNVETTRLGAALRRFHLDEFPQLYLVPLGKMSLVGPRPEMPDLAGDFEATFGRERTSVRPGVTGLWQVSDGAGGLIGETPEYDEFYVRHASAALDLWLLWRTLLEVLPWGSPVKLVSVPSWARRSHVATLDLTHAVEDEATELTPAVSEL